MSVEIVERPYLFSWARNHNRLRLLCDSTGRENYTIAARVSVWVNDYNTVKEYRSEVMVFHPDSEGYVNIPLDILAGYIPQPDLPDGSSFQLLTNAVLKYQIGYSEMYGSPAPTLHGWHYDSVRYALCGEVVERYARLNLPDWNSGQVKLISNSEDVFWLIGEPTEQRLTVQHQQAVYLYGLWYNERKASSDVLTLDMSVVLYSDNGTSTTQRSELKPTNGSVYRIDLSPSAVGADADTTLYYWVTIRGEGCTWSRRYDLMADRWKSRTVLMQSKYGVLMPWLVEDLKREITIEAESLTIGHQHYNDAQGIYELYTATTPLLTAEEARRFGQCLASRYQYMRSGGAWVRFVVEPASFSVLNEPDNMVRVEFKLRFVEDQQENMSDAPRSQEMTFNYYDLDEQVVAFSHNITPAGRNFLFD